MNIVEYAKDFDEDSGSAKNRYGKIEKADLGEIIAYGETELNKLPIRFGEFIQGSFVEKFSRLEFVIELTFYIEAKKDLHTFNTETKISTPGQGRGLTRLSYHNLYQFPGTPHLVVSHRMFYKGAFDVELVASNFNQGSLVYSIKRGERDD